MRRPLIGITAGQIYNRDYPWAPVTYGQRHTFTDSIIRAGGSPVILPITAEEDVIDDLSGILDGLLLSGGNDISPKMYGEQPYVQLEDISELRDRVEKRLLANALKNQIPILAICRGMQFLNVYDGGNLYQDIATDLPNSLNHESSNDVEDLEHKAHALEIEKDSKLYKILGTTNLPTNTHHHQAIKRLGKRLRVSAKSEDGIIEGIETTDDRFIIGVQGHPESLGLVTPAWEKLFQAFVKESSKTHTPSAKKPAKHSVK